MIVQETQLVTAPDSRKLEIAIRIHPPEPDTSSPHNAYRCLLEIDGAIEPQYAFGVTSLQALALAFTTLHRRLHELELQGWSLGHKAERVPLTMLRHNLFPDYIEHDIRDQSRD